jgi:hypothetical protein
MRDSAVAHKALVFLSCGQRSRERKLAKKVEDLITSDEFGLSCYNADSRQTFDDVMSIVDHLSKADYYLFIDFKRRGKVPISVFTHQEFALARACGITEMLGFREKGTPSRGIGVVEYVLAHPIQFERDNLLELVRENIKRKKWTPTYSRNLVASQLITPVRPVNYADGLHGANEEMIWHVLIENRRKDRAALNTIAILDKVTNADGQSSRPDRTYLKWAGLSTYQRTIFPEDSSRIDAFALRLKEPGVFLHSISDEPPRRPIITESGVYVLTYLLYADLFLPVRFEVELNYSRTPAATTATLLAKEVTRSTRG